MKRVLQKRPKKTSTLPQHFHNDPKKIHKWIQKRTKKDYKTLSGRFQNSSWYGKIAIGQSFVPQQTSKTTPEAPGPLQITRFGHPIGVPKGGFGEDKSYPYIMIKKLQFCK